MTISAKTWNDYVTRLSQLNRKAGQLMQQYMDTHGTEDADALIRYAYALVTKYGEGSAELACQMYDALAEAEGVLLPAAEPAATASCGEVARMVHATKDQNPANLPNGVSRLVKRAGADTTLHNAVRDGAEWAWVPHGDTCPFCITLASRGWQTASQKMLKGGHAEHIHAHCDCEFAVRFHSGTNVAGYDPEKYLKQYRDAGSDVNAMRRIDYAARKDAINAQKRAAYAARKLSTNRENPAKIGLDNDRYTIAEPKISKFLLKPGAKHSAEFFNVGYTEQDGMLLNADIYRQFDDSLKTDIRTAEDGTESFSIFMELGTTDKKTFRTVWRCDSGSEKPRLITAHREDKK